MKSTNDLVTQSDELDINNVLSPLLLKLSYLTTFQIGGLGK